MVKHKHSIDTGHPPVCKKDFHAITKGFNHFKFKRKICEALLMKNPTNTKWSRAHSNA